MKKAILSIVLLVITIISSTETNAQKFPKMDVSPMDAASFPNNWKDANKLVKIIYSRPQLKGRSLDKLAPLNKVWRTGANEAAEVTFYKDVTFGDRKVKKGTYTMFSIPTEGDWTIILSNQKNVWGAYFYDKTQDVVRVPGKVTKSEENIEAFSIVFDGEGSKATMHMGWGKKVISLPVVFENE
ncbi:DUF2911 domain-containing protein [Polaribacter sp. MSW13]|uniref:DUF2911 domain-containing protein n=1 Tax=Polaribacter marinus TaxID=2916838 RepID=A0A9X2ANU0_9FLAO|nr:DUF2911 domain-containing protein [Polaribacter marinus]MCI2230264.1 DUF2911 domain-containing protein [Polaribacter marinus]